MRDKEKIVLAIETALHPGSASILAGESEIDFIIGDAAASRSEDLLPLIDGLLKKNRIHRREIDLIAVSNGPGSFTGIRVGVAIAKGLAKGLGCASVGVSTLQVLARAAEKPGMVKSLIAGGRSQAFAQDFYFAEDYSVDGSSEVRISEFDKVLAETDISDYDAIILDAKLKQIPLPAEISRMMSFQPENGAKYVGLIALKNYRCGILSELIPQYLQTATTAAVEIVK